MTKIMVISCDGTLDSPEICNTHIQTIHEKLLGPDNPDNVVFIRTLVNNNTNEGWETYQYQYNSGQKEIFMRAHYEAGPGAAKEFLAKKAKESGEYIKEIEDTFKEIAAASVGINIMDIVRRVYRELVLNFDPGDKIYFFGFSRGAAIQYFAEQIINHLGIINRGVITANKKNHQDIIDEGISYCLLPDTHANKKQLIQEFSQKYAYKNKDFMSQEDILKILEKNKDKEKLENKDNDEINEIYKIYKKHIIHFMAYFELVEGPILAMVPHGDDGSNVCKHRLQICAIDEHRKDFKLKKLQPNIECDHTITWLAGAHSDLGGAYKDNQDQSVSYCSLRFVVEKAMQCGLPIKKITFNKDYLSMPLGIQHNSMQERVPFFSRVEWRNITTKHLRTLMTMPFETIHPSVYERYKETVEIQEGCGIFSCKPYAPENLNIAITELQKPNKFPQKELLLFNGKYGFPVTSKIPPANQQVENAASKMIASIKK